MFDTKKLALFLGGVVFGSAGFKVLSSKDAKKVYTQTTFSNCGINQMSTPVLQTLKQVWNIARTIGNNFAFCAADMLPLGS